MMKEMNNQVVPRFNDGRDWMFEKKFGMFVHWGLYALTEWHEQALWRREMKRSEYESLANEFNPVGFDPNEWIDAAESAGMEYICFTTKHHDGFCMWDTAETSYNIMNTPYGKDVLKMLADACEQRGMGLGLYYSLPDWHCDLYPNLGRSHEMRGMRAGMLYDEEKYLDFMERQLKELLSNYGKINQLFFDVNRAGLYRPSIIDMVREMQPGIIINDRGPGEGDFKTPERGIPDGGVVKAPTMAVNSTGRESWGYRADEDYYTHEFLMQSISRIMAIGGSYQLNIGPDPQGKVCPQDRETLKVIGDWWSRVKEAYTGTMPCTFMLAPDGPGPKYDQVYLTRKSNLIYVSAADGLKTCGIRLSPLNVLPQSATLLNDGRDVKCLVDIVPWRWRGRPTLRLANLPVNEFREPLVIKMDFSNVFDD